MDIIILTLSYICFILTIIANSIMDTVDHHMWNSVFYRKECTTKIFGFYWNIWWCIDQGWRNKYVDRDVTMGRRRTRIFNISFITPVMFVDAWHFFKACMILFFILSSILLYFFILNTLAYYFYILIFLGYVTTWGIVFELFYAKLLRRD